MPSLLGSLLTATLLLTFGGSSALEAEGDSGPHILLGRKVLQAGPAPAPGPFQFGAILPNSDPTCDPQWAYETGCYSDYSCAKGHICTCKNGDKCSDGGYFGIFLCPCDEAPRVPPTPSPLPPPPPPNTCIQSVKVACPTARNTTDARAKCTALGGTIISISATKYSCTCCGGSASIYTPSPPAIRSPPPPPYPSQSNLGSSIQKKVGIIIGCTWGGILLIIGTVVTCYCCYCKKKGPGLAARRNDLEQPPLIARPTRAPKTKSGGASEKAGAKKWFEPGFNGSTFKTTGAGLIFSKLIPKNARFVEMFATVNGRDGNGAGTSSATGSEAHLTKRDDSAPGAEAHWSEWEESPPEDAGTYSYSRGAANAASERTAKGKEPEAPAADAPPASIEGLPEDEICIVCCNAPKECVFVPCGHHATCVACGRVVQQGGQGCPVCRGPIERVLKIYEA